MNQRTKRKKRQVADRLSLPAGGSEPCENGPQALPPAAEPRLRYDLAGLLIMAAVAAFVIATRLWALGAKPFHHDESMFAHRAFLLLTTGDYRYEPILHGPFLQHVGALIFRLLGDSDTTARLPAAMAGVLLVLAVWRLRDVLGNLAALLAVLLLAASPTLLFYSRFNRNDVLVTLAAATFVFCAARFLQRGRLRWWFAALLAVGWMICIKETYVIFLFTVATFAAGAVIVGIALGWAPSATVRETWKSPGNRRRLLAATALGLAAAAALIVTLYTTCFRHLEHALGPIEALRYWSSQHAQQRIFGEFHYYVPILLIYEFLALAFLIWGVARTLRRAPSLRGWIGWGWAAWSAALLIVLLRYRLPPGFQNFTHMNRGWHLWLAVEVFTLSVAACAVLAGERRWIHAFFLWWTVVSFLAYSYAGEKVPWIAVHIVFPMIVSASLFAQEIARAAARQTPSLEMSTVAVADVLAPLVAYARSGFPRLLTSAALVVAFAATVAVSSRLAFINHANPAERHVYTHTTADYKAMVEEIADVAARTGPIPPEKFPVVIAGDSQWPGEWYFRRWFRRPAEMILTQSPIIIMDEYLDPGHREQHALTRFPWLLRTHVVRRVPFREWWHQEPLFDEFARLFDIWMALAPKQYRQNPLTDARGRPVGWVGDRARLPNMTVGDAIKASRRAWRAIFDYAVFRIDFDPYRFPYPTRDHMAVLFCVRKDLYKRWTAAAGRPLTAHSRRLRRPPPMGTSER